MSKVVNIGGVLIGGDNPIRVQSMCSTKTSDVNATVAQIKELEDCGCEIIRVAVPDIESAKALAEIKKQINIPLIADIHFDHKLGILSIPHIDKLRINPGTMHKDGLKELVNAAKEKGIPIRVGINAASMEKDLVGSTVDKMIKSVEQNIKLLEELEFFDIVVALKSSDVIETIEAYKTFVDKYDYPIHLGLTEAGGGVEGAIRSSVAMGILLNEGIGDTIRISLTGDPVKEVEAAYEILNALHLREKPSPTIISCPTCARCSVDLDKIVSQVKEKIKHVKKPIKIAIMGCEVNGPGESKGADLGLAFSNSKGFIFKDGTVIKEVSLDSAVDIFVGLVVQW